MIDQYDMRDRRLLSLDRELDDLHQRYWKIMQLEEPVQRGWTRFYTVAEKAVPHKHRAMLQSILHVIATTSWSRTPDFRGWRWRRKQRGFVEIEQPLRNISAAQWEHRKLPETWKRYFCLEPVRQGWFWHPTYVFSHRRLVELKVEPLFVSELMVPDPEIVERIAEIEQWLLHRNLRPRLDWLRGIRRGAWKHDPRRRLISHLHLQEMQHALKNYPEVDPVSVLHRYRISLWSIFSPA